MPCVAARERGIAVLSERQRMIVFFNAVAAVHLERPILSGNVRQIQGKVSLGPLHRKEISHVIITTT
jgi:hypothetical protein